MHLTLPSTLQNSIAPIQRYAVEVGVRIYLVGGIVRDLLLFPDRNASYDLDFVLEGDAPTFATGFADTLRDLYPEARLTIHAAFRTATLQLTEALHYDFTTARTETYPEPAQLPIVQPATLEDDLRRRDFTINALALALTDTNNPVNNTVIDLHGGLSDLQNGILRVLHPASFQDDPTRLFRLARFAVRLGFQPHGTTLALIPDALPVLKLLSGERLRHELNLILAEVQPERSLVLLNTWRVLAACKPALIFSEQAIGAIVNFRNARSLFTGELFTSFYDSLPSRALVYWTIWATECGDQLLKLTLPKGIASAVEAGMQLDSLGDRLNGLVQITPVEVTALFDPVVARAGIAPLVALAAMREQLPDGTQVAKLVVNYVQHWQYVQPTVTGRDLIARGLKPGAAFGRLLGALRVALLDGVIQPGADELAFIERWQASQDLHGNLRDDLHNDVHSTFL